MLTGALVQVRFSRDLVVPRYVEVDDRKLGEDVVTLLALFRESVGSPRGQLEQSLLEAFGEEPGQFVRRGIIKLIDDRCEWSIESAVPPEQVRAELFGTAFAARAAGSFDRATVLASVAERLGITAQQVDDALFADLKIEQRLIAVDAVTPRKLLERYNVALAQSVVLKATRVTIELKGLSSARWRRLLRLVKFHRLMAETSRAGSDTWRLTLDGPMSMFSSTQKYGLQLALFLPAILNESAYTITADLRWGPEKKPKRFVLTEQTGLVAPYPETGTYVPPEVAMFAEQFRKKVRGWTLTEEVDIVPLGDGFWVPDFRLIEDATGRDVHLEILGFWRKGVAEKHIARLREHARRPYVVAVSTSLKIDEEELPAIPNLVEFRTMPVPERVAAAAAQALAGIAASSVLAGSDPARGPSV